MILMPDRNIRQLSAENDNSGFEPEEAGSLNGLDGDEVLPLPGRTVPGTSVPGTSLPSNTEF